MSMWQSLEVSVCKLHMLEGKVSGRPPGFDLHLGLYRCAREVKYCMRYCGIAVLARFKVHPTWC
jgi:hypothetical protein